MGAASATAQTETLSAPTFGRVTIYAPASTPSAVVLFVSGDAGWNQAVVSMAEHLRARGALVVGIDIRSFLRGLEAPDSCSYPAGDLEELSRNVQLHRKMPVYKRPLLVGYSSGATLVYAALTSAPPETFAGAISLGFCPEINIRTPLCEMRGLKTRTRTDGRGYDVLPFQGLKVPWMVLQGEADQVCPPAATRAFVSATGSARVFSLPGVGHDFGVPRNWESQFIDAFRRMTAAAPREEDRGSIPEVGDLPLTEVAAAAGTTGNRMAVIVSGDGGWAELDKGVAAALAVEGVPTVGWSSLRYFWTPRTPDQAAADLARIVSHYSRAWGRPRVVLIGYSFGADVLPFLVNRLPRELESRIDRVALLGLSPTATFEFHMAEWFGMRARTPYQTVPEVERLSQPVVCVRGTGEDDSACPSLRGPHIRMETIGEGHHFGNDYRGLAEAILRD